MFHIRMPLMGMSWIDEMYMYVCMYVCTYVCMYVCIAQLLQFIAVYNCFVIYCYRL